MEMKKKLMTRLLIPVFAVAFSHTVYAAPVELSLDDSIALALKNNYDIKIANSGREKYYWAVKQAEANKKFSLNYTHTDEPKSDSNYYNNQLSLSLPVYSGGKLESQIDQAKLNLKVADLDVDATKQQLKLSAITDYFAVLEYRNELQVSQDTVNNYTDHLNMVEAKYNIGTVAKTDVLSSQVDLAKAQDSLIKAQNNYNNAVASLNNVMRLPHETELKLKDDFKYEKYNLTLEDCLQYAVAYRPELAQYEAKIASAEDDIKIAKGDYRPQVNLSVGQGWNNDHFPGTDNSNWQLTLTTSLNLFDSGLTDSKVKQAQHGLDTVREQAGKERDTILLNVRQYYLSMHEAEKRIDTNKVSVNQAAESLMIQKARYEAGVGTNLDVTDAVLALDSAKKDYIQALYDYNTNRANLEQAMGLPVK